MFRPQARCARLCGAVGNAKGRVAPPFLEKLECARRERRAWPICPAPLLHHTAQRTADRALGPLRTGQRQLVLRLTLRLVRLSQPHLRDLRFGDHLIPHLLGHEVSCGRGPECGCASPLYIVDKSGDRARQSVFVRRCSTHLIGSSAKAARNQAVGCDCAPFVNAGRTRLCRCSAQGHRCKDSTRSWASSPRVLPLRPSAPPRLTGRQ
jgi:hypothetical protein